MTPIAQLVIVFQNTLKNSGNQSSRNLFQLQDVMDETKLSESIHNAIKLLANGGHVLVKFKDKMFMAEKDNVNPERDYVTRGLTYHPHQDKFTI